uniref:Uncharacterized protein n=1 Tax=Anguilla anguilla TaxID=7936 RepID=A0A0E9RXL1_ANGAN
MRKNSQRHRANHGLTKINIIKKRTLVSSVITKSGRLKKNSTVYDKFSPQ